MALSNKAMLDYGTMDISTMLGLRVILISPPDMVVGYCNPMKATKSKLFAHKIFHIGNMLFSHLTLSRRSHEIQIINSTCQRKLNTRANLSVLWQEGKKRTTQNPKS